MHLWRLSGAFGADTALGGHGFLCRPNRIDLATFLLCILIPLLTDTKQAYHSWSLFV